ncbi:MAG: patatin-like phospholipase family protein [Planctomycetaceae bacterium]
MIQQSVRKQRRRAALALGGGGARGLAHLGVVEVLRQTPIHIERIVGVSIGSLAGALCAVDEDVVGMQKRVIKYLTSKAFNERQASLFAAAPPAEEPSTSGMFAWYEQIKRYLGARRQMMHLLRKPSLLSATVIQAVIDALLPDIDIRDTRIPLSIVALDLYRGRPVVLERGPMKDAVMASAAIPGVFPPVEMDGMLLCDIGLMDSLPTKYAAQRASDLAIAVNVGSHLERIKSCQTAAEIFLRLSDIGEHLVRDYTRVLADLEIVPKVSERPWFDFRDPESLIESGRVAARKAVCSTELLPPPRFCRTDLRADQITPRVDPLP